MYMNINELDPIYKDLILRLFTTTTLNRSEINILFEFYNKNYTPKEYGRGCSGCVKRVTKRIKEDFKEQI